MAAERVSSVDVNRVVQIIAVVGSGLFAGGMLTLNYAVIPAIIALSSDYKTALQVIYACLGFHSTLCLCRLWPRTVAV